MQTQQQLLENPYYVVRSIFKENNRTVLFYIFVALPWHYSDAIIYLEFTLF